MRGACNIRILAAGCLWSIREAGITTGNTRFFKNSKLTLWLWSASSILRKDLLKILKFQEYSYSNQQYLIYVISPEHSSTLTQWQSTYLVNDWKLWDAKTWMKHCKQDVSVTKWKTSNIKQGFLSSKSFETRRGLVLAILEKQQRNTHNRVSLIWHFEEEGYSLISKHAVLSVSALHIWRIFEHQWGLTTRTSSILYMSMIQTFQRYPCKDKPLVS